jgi:hypothetical protein
MLRSWLNADLKILPLIVPLIGATLASVAFAQGVSPAPVKRAKQSVVAIEDGRRQYSERAEQLMLKAQAYCNSQACSAALLEVRITARERGALKGAAGPEDTQLRRELLSKMSTFIHAYRDEHPEYSAEFAQNQWVERIDEINAKVNGLPEANDGLNIIPSRPSSPNSWLDPVTPSGGSCASTGCKHPIAAGGCSASCAGVAFFALLGCDALALAPPLLVACYAATLSAEGFCVDACLRTYCD